MFLTDQKVNQLFSLIKSETVLKHKIFLSLIFLCLFSVKGYSQSVVNYVCSFNGYYSYANLGNFINPATAFTLEAWVNPREASSITMSVIGKNYQTGYFLGIQSSGRIVFYPKGGSFLRSRVSGTVPAGQWTHIAATYNGSLTSIYINGVLDTSTTAITGAPTPNNDTLFVGADRVGADNLFFYGYMDNIRIWTSARTAAEIKDYRSIPFNFVQPSGVYSTIVKSIQFNNDINNYAGRNLTLINYSNKAVNISDYNNNLVLNGTTDYCTHSNDNNWFNLPDSFTLEVWAKRDTTGAQPLYQNLITKSGGTSGMDYGLYFSSDGGDVYFAINNFSYILQAPGVIRSSQWTHLAVSYYPTSGKAVIYCNGDSVAGTIFSGNPSVNSNPYKIYLGATGASNTAANKLKGQLDDIKIWYKSARTGKEIRENMFANSIMKMQRADSVLYISFDRFSDGIFHGGGSHIGGLKYFGNAHINSSHSDNQNSSSPVISDPLGEFNSAASPFTMSYKKFYVPDGNITRITDSIYISEGSPVSNLRVCVLMSHSYTRDVDLILIAPSGASVYLLEKNGAAANDVMTIFSDAADSLASFGIKANGPGINSPFSPMIKANQPLSMLYGQNRKGWWKLKISDNATPDVGYVLGWGLNMRSQRTLKLSALLEGFYNFSTNKMIPDSAKVFLRSAAAPYSIVDSAVSILDSNGKGSYYFNKAVNSAGYYAVLSHRNSVETWSSSGIAFSSDTLSYDFTSAISKAYGNNQQLIDSSPLKYGVYSGDLSRDGNVNLTDITGVYNDAANFETGYMVTDLNGDNTVNLNDIVLVYNNSKNFIALQRP